ncbi:MAG: hypothetical protein R8G66_15965 [Cytophagales bacterium]|nr:hypothetical protein [Cytophagales bacterium]
MKNKKSLLAVLVLLSAIVVNANVANTNVANPNFGKDKVLNKARKAVASNFDNSWKVFAQSASMIIKEDVALEEAKSWLDASLKIQKTSFNLEVMGDYYFATGDKKSAIKYYHESLVLLKETTLNPDTGQLQAKIWKSR